MKYVLPEHPYTVVCDIVNFNTYSQPGSHWVCHYRNKNQRIYFDSYGQVTPVEMQRRNTGTEFDQHKAQVQVKRIQIRLSAKQVSRNVSYIGGFIGMLASLAARAIPLVARALPTILSGLTTSLLSGGINKAISSKGVGDGLYLHKYGKGYRVQKMKGDGLYLAPHPSFVEGDGLFLKHGEDISDGAGLLMGKNSPSKNIPVLGLLL